MPPRTPRKIDRPTWLPALRAACAAAFEFHLVKRPQVEARIRLPADQTASSLSPLELLEQYWRASHADSNEAKALQKLVEEIIRGERDS